MLTGPARLIVLSIACLALMSFKLGQKTGDENHLLFDVRSAFVTSRSDIPAELMQRVHHHVSAAIQAMNRKNLRPRVILAIRISPVEQSAMLIGHRAASQIAVRATAVTTGEAVAEAKFRATTIGWTKEQALSKLGDGIARQVIEEFRLAADERADIISALAPFFPG